MTILRCTRFVSLCLCGKLRHRFRRDWRAVVTLACCWSLLSSLNCATVRPYRVTDFFRSPRIAEQEIKRVAVLPFENLTGHEAAGGVVTEEFMLQLGRTGMFDLVERGRIEELWKEQDLDTLARFDEAAAVRIGKMLGADGVILGTVTKYAANPQVKVDTIPQREHEHDHDYGHDYPPIVVIGPDRHHDDCDVAIAVLAVLSVVGIAYLLLKPRAPAAQVGASVRLVGVESGLVLWQAKDAFDGGRKQVQVLEPEREDRLRMMYDVEFLTRVLCRELVSTLAPIQ
jgi:TolB-like protein